jgi:hypothetical protein
VPTLEENAELFKLARGLIRETTDDTDYPSQWYISEDTIALVTTDPPHPHWQRHDLPTGEPEFYYWHTNGLWNCSLGLTSPVELTKWQFIARLNRVREYARHGIVPDGHLSIPPHPRLIPPGADPSDYQGYDTFVTPETYIKPFRLSPIWHITESCHLTYTGSDTTTWQRIHENGPWVYTLESGYRIPLQVEEPVLHDERDKVVRRLSCTKDYAIWVGARHIERERAAERDAEQKKTAALIAAKQQEVAQLQEELAKLQGASLDLTGEDTNEEEPLDTERAEDSSSDEDL